MFLSLYSVRRRVSVVAGPICTRRPAFFFLACHTGAFYKAHTHTNERALREREREGTRRSPDKRSPSGRASSLGLRPISMHSRRDSGPRGGLIPDALRMLNSRAVNSLSERRVTGTRSGARKAEMVRL